MDNRINGRGIDKFEEKSYEREEHIWETMDEIESTVETFEKENTKNWKRGVHAVHAGKRG